MTHLRTTRTYRFLRRTAALSAGIMVAAVLATACAAGSPRGELAENQQILSTCDPAAPPASMVQIDGTGSSASEAITAERMDAIESIVGKTAICSGHLKVLAFSASSVATISLFDGPLHPEGATDNARLKRVPAMVSDVMDQIRAAYEPAIKRLSNRGSDITAQLRLANEWMGQLGDHSKLHLYVLTDGFQTVNPNLSARALSHQEAVAAAGRLEVPDLSGASVVVAGLGRVVGSPPASSVVEGLVSFYEALCQKTNAAKCLAVTDYTAGR